MEYEEKKRLAQQQAQIKSEMARYEDELARKRMQVCDPIASSALKHQILHAFMFHAIWSFSGRE